MNKKRQHIIEITANNKIKIPNMRNRYNIRLFINILFKNILDAAFFVIILVGA